MEGYGWFGLLKAGRIDGLEALLKGIDARAVLGACPGGGMCWDITLEETASEEEEPLAVQVAKGTVLYSTQFENHIPLLQSAV